MVKVFEKIGKREKRGKNMINSGLQKFFKNNKLIKFPKKYDYRQEVLFFFYNLFEDNKEYSEKEINEIIKIYYDDFPAIRRYLVDYKFLIRDKRGSIYIKNLNKAV